MPGIHVAACSGIYRSLDPGAKPRDDHAGCVMAIEIQTGTAQAAAVVGSIIFFTSVILVAGKPLISACLRMIASSLAR